MVLARPSAPKHGERKGVDDDAGTGCCGAGQGPKGRRRWVESDKLARTLLVSRSIRTTTTQPSAPKGWRERERERERGGEPEVSEYVCVSVCVQAGLPSPVPSASRLQRPTKPACRLSILSYPFHPRGEAPAAPTECLFDDGVRREER